MVFFVLSRCLIFWGHYSPGWHHVTDEIPSDVGGTNFETIAGLTEMWLLQHCRNNDGKLIGLSTPKSFIPFSHIIHIHKTLQICIPN